MEVRSTNKNQGYFDQYISTVEEIIDESYEDLKKGEVKSAQIKSFKANICSSHLKLVVAKYSAGFPIQELQQDLKKAIALLDETWSFPEGPEVAPFYWDTFPEYLWMLSIACCLDMDANEIAPLIRIADNAAGRDWLVDFLISNFRISQFEPPLVIFPKPYGTIRSVIAESNSGLQSLKLGKYLEKEWYPGHKGVYWYDNHKSKHDIFFGYWSFEAAAVVKIAGIDDSSFRDNQYYPKDMLG
jgi:hypothetical protein